MDEIRIGEHLKTLRPQTVERREAKPVKSFSETLKESIQQVNELQLNAQEAVKELMVGESKNIHQTMIAIEKADLSFRLMMQVRNKLVDAYREIMRMTV